MKPIPPIALFRLSVLGPLASRQHFSRGELQVLIQEQAAKHYDIPGSLHTRISGKTIEAWFYRWKKGGIEALAPKPRCDKGVSRLPQDIQAFIVKAKQENPKRSLNTLLHLVQMKGFVQSAEVSRSSVYRLLSQHGLSRPVGSASQPIEFRSFQADEPGAIVYGDVMHGPVVWVNGKTQKSYLVTVFDDCSRLVLHSAFCPGETALQIEYVLKQALLKRGLPKRFILDNGAAYRAHSLQGICARCSIQIIYCRPYAPEGKGKLERWHRTLRDQFLTELPRNKTLSLLEINSLLWAWIDQIYHAQAHSGLQGKTPLSVWQQGLKAVQPLGPLALQLDEIFYHRIARKVRKDGSVSYLGKRFEVPYEHAGKTILLVIDPHQQQVLFVESEAGERLGQATPLDLSANQHRKRRKSAGASPSEQRASGPLSDSVVTQALEQQHSQLSLTASTPKLTPENTDNKEDKRDV